VRQFWRGTGLRRALTALIDNAIRHATSSVTVTVIPRGSQAVAVVADDGAGIDPAMLSRMFERFASTANPANGHARRYGLGLALVAELAHRYGGRVTAYNSAAGTGAELHLLLPIAVPPRPSDTVPRRWWSSSRYLSYRG
jgi:two-component system OmpR family sensor kinase